MPAAVPSPVVVGGGAVSFARSSTDEDEFDSNRPVIIFVFRESVDMDFGFTEIQNLLMVTT